MLDWNLVRAVWIVYNVVLLLFRSNYVSTNLILTVLQANLALSGISNNASILL